MVDDRPATVTHSGEHPIPDDVAHWLALLSDGKCTLSRSEMWDIAAIISRQNAEIAEVQKARDKVGQPPASAISDAIHNLHIVREALQGEGLHVHVDFVDGAIETLSEVRRGAARP
jgi:hypothetical protein